MALTGEGLPPSVYLSVVYTTLIVYGVYLFEAHAARRRRAKRGAGGLPRRHGDEETRRDL